jgi:ankyrin repeat protein
MTNKGNETNEYEKVIARAKENMMEAKAIYDKSNNDEDKEAYNEANLQYMRICKDIYTLKNFESKIKGGTDESLLQLYDRIKGDEKYKYLFPFFLECSVKVSIKKGYTNFLNKLLSQHELDLTKHKIDGLPLLFYATEKDSKKSIEIFIKYSAPLNEQLEDGRILLHFAAEKGNYNLSKKLIEENKNSINKETKEGKTPLYYAIKNRHYNIVALLVKSGAKCEDKLKSETKIIPLRTILDTGEIPLVSIKDDIFDEKKDLSKDEKKWKEAYEYIKKGDILKIYELINNGIDFTQMYVDGNSALDIAIHYDQFYISRLLINIFDFTKIVNLKNGMTPLHHAILHKNINLFYLLSENGFDLNAIDSLGNTPLHYAVTNKSYLITEMLVIKGADSNKTNYKEQNPLHLAVLEKEPGIVRLLIYKTNINKQDSYGNTPLHLAAKYYDKNVFNILCRRKKYFDCSIKNDDNQTPHNISDIDYFDNLVKEAKKTYNIFVNESIDGTIKINITDRSTRKKDIYVFNSNSDEEDLILELNKLKTEKIKDSHVKDSIVKIVGEIACKKDYPNLMKNTLDLKRNDINFTYIYYELCKSNSKKCIQFFSNKEINYRYNNFLEIAAKYGNIQLAKKVLESAKELGKGQNTPLGIAVYFNQYDMAEFLVKNGAHIDEKIKKEAKDSRMRKILNSDVSFLNEFLE